MIKLKEMPYSEKYTSVLDQMKMYDVLIPPFVRKHLGNQALVELQKIWQEGIKPVPEDASYEDKYELAYSNFIWQAKGNISFIRRHLGKDGIEQFELAVVEALKRKNASPAVFILGLLRAVLPSIAFTMTAKQTVYQWQWITPYSLSELTNYRAVFNIPRCKVLDFQDSDDICLVGCQSIFPKWLAEQFKVEMKFERQGNSCTGIVARLS